MAGVESITEDEAALYDRQIRLWGLDAQKRLRSANVLVAGLGGLAAEVVKNIILGGVSSVTLLDDRLVTEGDTQAQFFIPRTKLGLNRAEASLERAQRLNPMVRVSADTEPLSAKDRQFFARFDVVCVTECAEQSELVRVNALCRAADVKFYCGDIFGFYGYCFTDLMEHEYAEEKAQKPKASSTATQGPPAAKKSRLVEEAPDENGTKTVKKKSTFVSLETALKHSWKDVPAGQLRRTSAALFCVFVLMKFYSQKKRKPEREDKETLQSLSEELLPQLGVPAGRMPADAIEMSCGELSPVCAIVGGVLAQEIIKAVSQKDRPYNNMFVFDPVDSNGVVEQLGISVAS